jgi:drug/metabolite transporter superfamily protein YnfA
MQFSGKNDIFAKLITHSYNVKELFSNQLNIFSMSKIISVTGIVDTKWKSVIWLGSICTFIAFAGTIIDIVFGTISGGNLAELPQTAVERFTQMQSNPLLGLYNLDLLNIIVQLIMIPAYLALYVVLSKIQPGFSLLAFIVFLVGTIAMVTGNAALPMVELSSKYYAASSESQKILFAAAGEAMLLKGIHGSYGMFISFILPNLGGILISWLMLKTGIFSKTNAWLGLIGSIMISVYLILVTFVPEVKSMATLFAAPGGLMLMAWMILFALRLRKISILLATS